MERQTIQETLQAVFRRAFKNPTLVVHERMSAADVPQWDSLNHMLLVAEVEQAFGFTFRLRDLNRMRDVGDMMDLIAAQGRPVTLA
jgi:acyl carrier protein